MKKKSAQQPPLCKHFLFKLYFDFWTKNEVKSEVRGKKRCVHSEGKALTSEPIDGKKLEIFETDLQRRSWTVEWEGWDDVVGGGGGGSVRFPLWSNNLHFCDSFPVLKTESQRFVVLTPPPPCRWVKKWRETFPTLFQTCGTDLVSHQRRPKFGTVVKNEYRPKLLCVKMNNSCCGLKI